MFNAQDFFNNRDGLTKPLYRYSTFGGTIGGPVYIPGKFNENRDKLFFFYSREEWRNREPLELGRRTVPTTLERGGDFSQTLDVGGRLIPIRDPLTGEVIQQVVDTGAFQNPCTLENVDVTGSSTITSLQTVDRFGTMKISVGVSTKGTGTGWVVLNGNRVNTGSTYAFSDSQQFSFRLPSAGDEFSSDFTDRLSMRGAKSVDNWTVRAHFKIRISAAGEVQVSLIKMTGDVCKG